VVAVAPWLDRAVLAFAAAVAVGAALAAAAAAAAAAAGILQVDVGLASVGMVGDRVVVVGAVVAAVVAGEVVVQRDRHRVGTRVRVGGRVLILVREGSSLLL
jgi:hypothetical protein